MSGFTDSQAQQGNGVVAGSYGNTERASKAVLAYGLNQELAYVPVQPFRDDKKITSVAEAIGQYSAFTPGMRAALQEQMLKAGYLQDSKDNPIIFGYDDPGGQTLGAFQKVLIRAAQMNKTPAEILDDAIESRKQAGINVDDLSNALDSQSKTQLANPDDLRAVAMAAGQTLLGQNPDEEFIQRFITNYQGSQRQEGSAANSGAGVYTSAPTAQNAAEMALRSERSADVQAYGEERNLDVFRNLVERTKNDAGV